MAIDTKWAIIKPMFALISSSHVGNRVSVEKNVATGVWKEVHSRRKEEKREVQNAPWLSFAKRIRSDAEHLFYPCFLWHVNAATSHNCWNIVQRESSEGIHQIFPTHISARTPASLYSARVRYIFFFFLPSSLFILWKRNPNNVETALIRRGTSST